jgi:hypothetical protein
MSQRSNERLLGTEEDTRTGIMLAVAKRCAIAKILD